MADSRANKEHLRNSKEADRRRRKAETSEQCDERLKRRRKAEIRRRETETPEKRRARLDQ